MVALTLVSLAAGLGVTPRFQIMAQEKMDP